MQTSPYRDISDDFLAGTSSFFLLVVFLCASAFRYVGLTNLDDIQLVLSHELAQYYVINPADLTIIIFTAAIGALLVTCVLFAVQLSVEGARLRHEAVVSKARRLRCVMDDSVAFAPKLADGYHLFLSHVWSTGQDQMRVVKQRLLEMVPNLHVFLDVDDLKEGRGAADVDKSNVVLIFASDGYFSSPNCMRELLRATFNGKPVVPLLEPELNKGGLTCEQVLSQLVAAETKYYGWGLVDEMETWGFAQPSAQQLYAHLFAAEPIEWNRIGVFQDVTLRLIASRCMPAVRGGIYVQGEVISQQRAFLDPPQAKYHVYCSPHNDGALQLLQDLAQKTKLQISVQGAVIPQTSPSGTWSLTRMVTGALHDTLETGELVLSKHTKRRKRSATGLLQVSTQVADMASCNHMLVYLNATTWTRGDTSASFAAEVAHAMDAGVHLLLAHEMVGIEEEERRGVDFARFFACENGATPPNLLKRGIYNEIALPLKGGPWREASFAMMHDKLAGSAESAKVMESMKVSGQTMRSLDALQSLGTRARLNVGQVDWHRSRSKPRAYTSLRTLFSRRSRSADGTSTVLTQDAEGPQQEQQVSPTMVELAAASASPE